MKTRLKRSVIGVAYIAALIFAGNAFAQTNNTANVKLLLEVQNMRQELSALRNKVEKQGYLIRELQKARGVEIANEAVVSPNLSSAQSTSQIPAESLSNDNSVTSQSGLGEIPAQGGASSVVDSSGQVNSGGIDFPLQPGASQNSSVTTIRGENVPNVVQNPTADAVNSKQHRLLVEGDNAIKTNLGEMELYNKGIAKLRSQEYKSAASIFSAQLQNHPKGAKAADGYFWLAETFYILNDLDSSAKSYESLFSLFPKNPRAPKALFKLIKVYLEKGDNVAAKSTVGKLVNLYSKSTEATEAKSLYRDLL